MTIIILGFLLVLAGLWFAIGGLGSAVAGGTALKGISINGPAWLLLVALGVGTILFGAWLEQTEASTPPTTIPEPYTFGDDIELDDLWDSCAEGDWTDCDELYQQAPVGSDYEWFGATCGYLVDDDGLPCEEAVEL